MAAEQGSLRPEGAPRQQGGAAAAAAGAAERDPYAAVRAALRQEAPATWVVRHIDITCDGCECEPIVGSRFKCTVCEDTDLCGRCMRALVAARLKMAGEGASLRPAKPAAAGASSGARPRRWASKLHSRHSAERWAALQAAVPCLHASHRFHKVLDGPEREVLFVGSSSGGGSADGRCSSGSAAAGPPEPQAAAGQLATSLAGLAVGSSCGDSGGSGSTPPDAGGSCPAEESLQAGGRQRLRGSGRQRGLAAELEEFLATFPPSGASCADLAWIAAAAPGDAGGGGHSGGKAGAGRPGEDQLAQIEERIEEALEEWEALTAPGHPPPTAADVDALARKHGLLGGKWMAFPGRGAEAEAAWAAVARAVVCQGLAPSAKISSVDPAKPDHVICVYTHNYLDVADVERVQDALRAALPPLRSRKRLLYKPDVFTYLGIYVGNEHGLRPTVYSAPL